VTVGADIGQKIDPTAIVVCEATRRETGRMTPPPTLHPGQRGVSFTQRPIMETIFTVRHIERMQLNTDYPSVAGRIAEVVRAVRDRYPPRGVRVYLTVDSTGVGRPLVDMLKEHLAGTAVSLSAATFVHGDRLDGHAGSRELRVGKAYLVSRLQALIQTDRMRLPAGHPEAQAMARELADYEIKVDQNANDTYGAFRVGTHDDLVTALGLAVLTDPLAQLAWSY